MSGNGRKGWNVNADLGKGHGAVGGSLQLLPLHMTWAPFSPFGAESRDWFVDAPPRRPLGCCRLRLLPGWLCPWGRPLKRPVSQFLGTHIGPLTSQLSSIRLPPVPGCDQLVNSPVSLATAKGWEATCFRWDRNLPDLDHKLNWTRARRAEGRGPQPMVHGFQAQDLGVALPHGGHRALSLDPCHGNSSS